MLSLTQNNLGIAYRQLAAHREPVANLERAAGAWAVSLIFFAREKDMRSFSPIESLESLRSEHGDEEFQALLELVTVQRELSQHGGTLEELSSYLIQRRQS